MGIFAGKFGGLVLTLAVNTIAMAVGLFLVMSLIKRSGEHLEGAVLVAVYFILLKLALVVALAFVIFLLHHASAFILSTAGLYIAGLFVMEMRAVQSDTILQRWAPCCDGFLMCCRTLEILTSWPPPHTSRDSKGADRAEHGVCGAVLRYCAGRRRRYFHQGET